MTLESRSTDSQSTGAASIMSAARHPLATLAVVVILTLLAVRYPKPGPPPPEQRGKSDVFTHSGVVDRIERGEGYYAGMGAELRRLEYPTRSVFNWRTPLHLYALAALPSAVTRGLFIALGLGAFLASTLVAFRRSGIAALVSAVLFFGVVVMVFTPTGIFLAEAWAGLLIALSVCAYLERRWIAGAAFGIAGLFVRELAGPYCLVCGLWSLRARRRKEALVWMTGALAYCVYFGVHAWFVSHQWQPDELAMTHSWIRFGGLEFIMATIRVNGCLIIWPGWAAAVFCALGAAAALRCGAPGYLRAAMLVYLAFFGVVGMPVNQYWGWITAFLWPMAVGFGADLILKPVRVASLAALGRKSVLQAKAANQ